MISTLTLNPAIDRILYLSSFEKNVTNRICDSLDTIGGKGTHVSLNLHQLGIDNQAFGIVHGDIGLSITESLKSNGINVKFKHKASHNSRINYLLIESSGDSTIIASKGVELKNEDIVEITSYIYDEIKDGEILVLSGDASNCNDPEVYNKLMSSLKGKHPKFFLDTSGETLKKCIKESPFLIKPNLDELSTLTGMPLTSDNEIIAAIDSLAPYAIEIIAVSLGGDGSIIKTPQGIYKITPPKVRVLNTIGCGDCFLSGLIYGIHQGLPIEKTLRLATAISAATAESSLSYGFDTERAAQLENHVIIEQIISN